MYNPQLETFIKVADLGSFSKAADALFVSPTAIIKQVNILESDLALQLFVRTHRGVKLTEAGTSLYNDAKYVIQYSKDSVSRAKNLMPGEDETIRIGTSPISPGQFLVDLWPKISEVYPNIKCKLVPFDNTPEKSRERFRNLGKDIDIIAGYFDPGYLQWRGCSALPLSHIPIRCAVPIRNRLAAKNELTVKDLYGENLMLIKRGWNSHVDALRDELIENHNAITITDFEFFNTDIFNQCENTNSVLIAVDHWKNVHPLIKIMHIDWVHTLPFGILHSPTPSNTVRKFLDAIQSINL